MVGVTGNGPYDYHIADDHVGIYREGGSDFVSIKYENDENCETLRIQASLLAAMLNRGMISVPWAIDAFGYGLNEDHTMPGDNG